MDISDSTSGRHQQGNARSAVFSVSTPGVCPSGSALGTLGEVEIVDPSRELTYHLQSRGRLGQPRVAASGDHREQGSRLA
jgi:hypothetical protein